MKKIALFAVTMLMCAGLAFAQAPQKKATNEKPKPEAKNHAPAVKSTDATAPATTEKVKPQAKNQAPAVKNNDAAPAPQKSCGNCPHHKQCDKSGQNASQKVEAPKEKPCHSKDAKNNDGNKKDNNAANNQTATKDKK